MAQYLERMMKTRDAGSAGETGERRRRRRASARAFTLLELLVVIAITGILLGLLFGPLLEGFNATSRARATASAQDAARGGLETIRRELSQAVYVFDNSAAPVNLPLQANQTGDVNRLPGPPDGLLNGTATPYVYPLLFAKIDFIPAARQGVQPGQVIDPTTGIPITPGTNTYGANLRFPLAPGTQIVRYFIGLRNPITVATGAPNYYSNPYEFPRSSGRNDLVFNPFILYRAEFDPSDPNYINQTTPNSTTPDNGGFNDPDFFYNQTATSTANGANGLTYAQNWQKIAQPVINTDNLDLMIIHRTAVGAIDPYSPFRSAITFQPTTVSGETATPGFLNNDATEIPGAVPSLYTAQHAQWVFPFIVTFSRASTNNSPTAPPGGSLTVQFSQVSNPSNPAVQMIDVEPLPATSGTGYGNGSLAMSDLSGFYCSYSPTTGQYFVKTPNLTFAVDPLRGRIITGFPPLAGTTAGVPDYEYTTSGGTVQMQAMTSEKTAGTPYDPTATNEGDPVPTIFRINTLDSFIAGTGSVPNNQGFLDIHLFTNQDDNPLQAAATNTGSNYYLNLTTALSAPDQGPYVSPMAVFGPMLIAAGTEHVVGPNSTLTVGGTTTGTAGSADNNTTNYYRIGVSDTLASAVFQDPSITTANGSYLPFTVPAPDYQFDYDFAPYDKLTFAEGQTTSSTVPGLPALAAGTSQTPLELRVSYYWQNNFARTSVGNVTYAIDANGNYEENVSSNTALQTLMGPIEADVVKLDYVTRDQINVNVGVRVYDVHSGVPSYLQLSDKIEINNGGR